MTSLLWFLLSLCLYPRTHASGGLVLIARQASKCLHHAHFFFLFKIIYSATKNVLDFAWQLIMKVWTSWHKNCTVLYFLDLFSPAGCLALWRGGQAAPQGTCVTCLQRWTPSSLPWPSSTSSTKLCWDLSCTDERAGFVCSGRNIHAIFDIIIFLMLRCSCVRPLCSAVWVFPRISPLTLASVHPQSEQKRTVW